MNAIGNFSRDTMEATQGEIRRTAKTLGITLLDNLGNGVWLITLPKALAETFEEDGWLEIKCQNVWLMMEDRA